MNAEKITKIRQSFQAGFGRPARFLVMVLIISGASRLPAQETTLNDPGDWAKKNLSPLVELYKELHANPELSYQEKETAARLAKLWKEEGFEVTETVGGHGIVGILKNGDGPKIMLRTDLDALPVIELTNLVYGSKVKVKNAEGSEVGVMHACGHDVHMTVVTGAGRYLAKNKDQWKGTLMLIGQPAEETGGGAKAMLDDGLFKRFPKPDFAVAAHVDAGLAAGMVGYRGGYMLANVDSVDITLFGRGGHGAEPQSAIDPVVMAAEFILSLQTIVSRERKPIDPAVITVGAIHGGTKHNIIADSCDLKLTVRSYRDDTREALLAAIKRKAEAVTKGAGSDKPPEIKVTEGTPALYNDDQLAQRLVPIFRKAIGETNLILTEPVMGGEDFSRYGREGVPIHMFRLGSVEKRRLDRWKELGQPPPSLHSPLYYPDIDLTLTTGVDAMATAAIELFKKP
jgi:amidohydrolase